MQKERKMNLAQNFGSMSVKRTRGFTLTEVMIVVAIIAIIAAVALPSYQDNIRKGRRAAAQTFMMEVANKQQQFLLDSRTYAATTAALSLTPPNEVSGYYTFTIATGATPPSYTITATPAGAQLPDGPLTLDNLGAKTRNGVAGW
jgi:type IV pilus assembly protein PilE